jgi:hypothetical protein
MARLKLTEIPTIFLRRLIAIGESQDFSELRQLFEEFPLRRVGHFMCQLPEFWASATDSLSDAELEALIRALTVAERDFPSFSGGSVSGVIHTFHRLAERNLCRSDALADWILAHTKNPWAPFGGAMSRDAWKARRHPAEGRVAGWQPEKERPTIAAERKAEKATQNIFSAIRRKDTKAVQALLLRGARLDVPDATGMTALAYAQALGHAPILELLQNNTNGLQPNA